MLEKPSDTGIPGHAGGLEPGAALLGTSLSYLVTLGHMHSLSSLK